MSITADVAEAIKSRLADPGAGPFSQEFTPVRKWRAVYSLEDLATLRVTILPGPLEDSILTRQTRAIRRHVDIAIQKRINPESVTEADALVQVLEEISANLANLELKAGTAQIPFHCLEQEIVSGEKAAIDRPTLGLTHTFQAVLRITCLVKGGC